MSDLQPETSSSAETEESLLEELPDDDQVEDLDDYTETKSLTQKRSSSREPETRPLSLRQEETRGKLALFLVIMLATSSTFVSVYSAFVSKDNSKSESLLTLVLTSHVALTGGALGFYFGQK